MLLAKFVKETKGNTEDLQFYKISLVVGENKRVLVNKCLPVSSVLEVLEDKKLELDKDTYLIFEPVSK